MDERREEVVTVTVGAFMLIPHGYACSRTTSLASDFLITNGRLRNGGVMF
jgi:mannitol/fructose-specific phosphotransferase system IIA component